MEKLSISEIAEKLKIIEDNKDPVLLALSADERKGVQQLIKKWYKQREQQQILREKFQEMTNYERKIRAEGFQYIAGIDEVGRGPLAGPVVAAAVILPEDFFLPGIDDSKKLSEKRRNELFDVIQERAIAISVSMVSAEEIDEINIYQATKKAMLSATAQLPTAPDFLLIDAMKLETPYPQESIIKGDAKSISIAAASIIAKVSRDRLMNTLAEQYPHYGFAQNAGYGTKEHILAIEKYGITPVHRKSFAPVKDYLLQRQL